MYKEKDIVRIAKRENNKKRKYIVVNRLQGKHIPVSPKEAFALFDALADIIRNTYKGERLLLVGFAETATAIGARLAVDLNTEYIQTTRENLEGVNYLHFTESHSHATDQKLVKQDIEEKIGLVDRIVFVEDEITTGNTVLDIINLLQKQYPGKVQYSVVSLMNGMDQRSLSEYCSRDINIHYLLKTDHSSYTERAELYSGNGTYDKMTGTQGNQKVSINKVTGYLDARRCVNGEAYCCACNRLWEQIQGVVTLHKKSTILVLGTEEFMYPALFVASEIERLGKSVRFHATTRSPIVVSKEDEYPLHHRFELASLYDPTRKTYIYDVGRYDQVFILTDATDDSFLGLATLLQAVTSMGNDNITVFRWCES